MIDLAEDGRPPQALLDEPDLPEDLRFVWDAFWRLHTDRPLGFAGVGPIPNSAVVSHAHRLGMMVDEEEWFVGLIGAMDREYRQWIERQRPKP